MCKQDKKKRENKVYYDKSGGLWYGQGRGTRVKNETTMEIRDKEKEGRVQDETTSSEDEKERKEEEIHWQSEKNPGILDPKSGLIPRLDMMNLHTQSLFEGNSVSISSHIPSTSHQNFNSRKEQESLLEERYTKRREEKERNRKEAKVGNQGCLEER